MERYFLVNDENKILNTCLASSYEEAIDILIPDITASLDNAVYSETDLKNDLDLSAYESQNC
jgi:hypothetical protein